MRSLLTTICPLTNMTTAIEKLSQHIKIDVDSMEPAVARSLPIKAWDMTSNQLLVNEQMTTPGNRDMLVRVAKEHQDEGWETIIDYVTAELAAQVKPYIQGRVLAQTSPRNAYDADKIAAHARNYKKAYASVGITPDEFCIKVPVTGAGMVAAKQLGEEGIRTLGTSLFSLHQAIAASQAGCLSISPYFNEVRAHAEVDMWPNSDDPATKHPMSYRMIHIAETYKRLAKETGKTQPLIKSASFISAAEALAMPELGAQHATISQQVLEELTKSNANLSAPRPAHPALDTAPSDRMAKLAQSDPLALADKEFKLASTDIDYLANGGKALDEANDADEVTRLRLHDALELFKGGEARSRAVIEEILAQIKAEGKPSGLSAAPKGIKV